MPARELAANADGMTDTYSSSTPGDRRLEGKAVVVTGGAKNLGGQVSRDLATQGARLAIHYNSDATASAADETVAAVKDAGGDAVKIQADLTDVSQVERVFEEAQERFGSLFATVNTAGMTGGGPPVVDMTEEEFDRLMAVNAKAAFFTMREAAKRTEDGGRIVTLVTSLVAAYAPGWAVYAGSKAPVEHFNRALSKEVMDRHISVNALAPGPMDTPFFWNAAHPGEHEFVISQVMGNQLTQVEDIVPWVRFLLTDGWWVNGQTLLVNGGFTTR
jgi:NAD(P)-dependent dehydrogenase (short-subunit alcohol dehydrogenase family)